MNNYDLQIKDILWEMHCEQSNKGRYDSIHGDEEEIEEEIEDEGEYE